MRGLIELAAVGMERTEDTDFDPLLARPAEHGAGGAAKQVIEQGPVVVEERPQQVPSVCAVVEVDNGGRFSSCPTLFRPVVTRKQHKPVVVPREGLPGKRPVVSP